MRVIAESTWSWLLYADGDRRWLAVVCGSVALHEVVIELDVAECALVAADASRIDALARAICHAPAQFRARHCPEMLDNDATRQATLAWRAQLRSPG